ncbi:hypothetical protein KAR28_06385 [Candidatus Parcubacteria bacterium]|nr:hypothetical protein [Candidatus Parcubacteria bacterium]
MKTQIIKPADAKNSDRVYIEMKRNADGSRGADRIGTVTKNDPEKKHLDIIGDNLVSISIEYDRIEKIEKIIADKL